MPIPSAAAELAANYLADVKGHSTSTFILLKQLVSLANMSDTLTKRDQWLTRFTWLLFLALIPLELTFFGGYGGQSDDVNDVHLTRRFLALGHPDPQEALHYRLMTLLPRAFFFWLGGYNDFTFIAPIFVFALAAAFLTIICARDLFGVRGGLLAALLLLTTPFQILAATMDVPDTITGFFVLGCAWALFLGITRDRRRWMVIAAVCVAGGVLNKVSALGVLPIIALVNLIDWRNWRRWLYFWPVLAAFISLFCIADYFYSGEFFRWYTFNDFFQGHNMNGRLLETWMRFPRYIVWRDEFGNMLFGLTGIAGALGALLSILRLLKGEHSAQTLFVFFTTIIFFLLVNFMPHKLTLEGYFSHYRIWRYLALISPFLYLSAVYLFVGVIASASAILRVSASAVFAGVLAVNVWQLAPATEPSWDSRLDRIAMLQLMQRLHLPPQTPIYTDQWKCDLLFTMWFPEITNYPTKCFPLPIEPREWRRIYGNIDQGLIITGGSTLAWYGNVDLLLNLNQAGFEPPPNWELLLERKAEPTRWRAEPLRIWLVHPQDSGGACSTQPTAALPAQ